MKLKSIVSRRQWLCVSWSAGDNSPNTIAAAAAAAKHDSETQRDKNDEENDSDEEETRLGARSL